VQSYPSSFFTTPISSSSFKPDQNICETKAAITVKPIPTDTMFLQMTGPLQLPHNRSRAKCRHVQPLRRSQAEKDTYPAGPIIEKQPEALNKAFTDSGIFSLLSHGQRLLCKECKRCKNCATWNPPPVPPVLSSHTVQIVR